MLKTYHLAAGHKPRGVSENRGCSRRRRRMVFGKQLVVMTARIPHVVCSASVLSPHEKLESALTFIDEVLRGHCCSEIDGGQYRDFITQSKLMLMLLLSIVVILAIVVEGHDGIINCLII